MKTDSTILLILVAAVGSAVYLVQQNKRIQPVAAVAGIPQAPASDFANTVVPGVSTIGQQFGSLLSSIFSPAGAGYRPPSVPINAPRQAPTTTDSVVTWSNRINSGIDSLSNLWNFFGSSNSSPEEMGV